MSLVELMLVEDLVEVAGRGVLLSPFFLIPKNWKSTPHSEMVIVEKPDGQSFETLAVFGIIHLNISDPKVPSNQRWKIGVRLPRQKKTDISEGSKILVSRDFKDMLIPPTNV